jgi:predicted O-methyltransferase YrrM
MTRPGRAPGRHRRHTGVHPDPHALSTTPTWRVAIAPDSSLPAVRSRAARLEQAEAYPGVDPVVLHAMSWAAEFGVQAVSPAVGSVLRLLATATRARSVVEVGTGTGVSGLWLLQGLPADAVLTSVDIEPEHQALARQSFAAAGFGPARYRLIAATAHTMLPRLADGGYDLMFVDGALLDYPYCVEQAHRILRPDGLLVVHHAHADVDEDADVVRGVVARLRVDPQWTATLLPAGDGLVCAARTA